MTKNEEMILKAKGNAIIIFNGRYEVFFDEKPSHFVNVIPSIKDCKSNNILHNLVEDVYVKDLETGISYQICKLTFMPMEDDNILFLTISADRTYSHITLDAETAIFKR